MCIYKLLKNKIIKKLIIIVFLSTSLFSNVLIAHYCVDSFTRGVEPIISIVFVGINNSTPNATVFGTSVLAHQDFTTISGNMIDGDSYPLALRSVLKDYNCSEMVSRSRINKNKFKLKLYDYPLFIPYWFFAMNYTSDSYRNTRIMFFKIKLVH